VPGAGGPDAAADPEQRGRPVGAGEHDQAPVRSESARLTGSRAAAPVSGPPGGNQGSPASAPACAGYRISKRLTPFDLLTRN